MVDVVRLNLDELLLTLEQEVVLYAAHAGVEVIVDFFGLGPSRLGPTLLTVDLAGVRVQFFRLDGRREQPVRFPRHVNDVDRQVDPGGDGGSDVQGFYLWVQVVADRSECCGDEEVSLVEDATNDKRCDRSDEEFNELHWSVSFLGRV